VSDIHWSRAAILRLAIASIALIGALFLFVFPTSSLLHQRAQLNDAKERLSVLREQNARLSHETKQVLSNDEIERLARSRFNMVRPGEQAYNVVPNVTSPAPTTTTSTP